MCVPIFLKPVQFTVQNEEEKEINDTKRVFVIYIYI